jgi:hypothetical protein
VFSNSLSDKDLHNPCFDKKHRKLFGIDFFNSLLETDYTKRSGYTSERNLTVLVEEVKKKKLGFQNSLFTSSSISR